MLGVLPPPKLPFQIFAELQPELPLPKPFPIVGCLPRDLSPFKDDGFMVDEATMFDDPFDRACCATASVSLTSQPGQGLKTHFLHRN